MKFSRILFLVVMSAGILVFAALAQSRAKRLILKDDSYQPATKWEIKGNRVRYYSAERFEWEEVPSSLIDWAATDRFSKELEAGSTAKVQQASAEDEAERKAEEAKSPTVAPGLQLPETGGVYLLDYFKGKPELDEVVQSGGELHKNMGRNILRAAINPVATSNQSIEIKGIRARIQAHESQPEIYLDVAESVSHVGIETDNSAPAPADASAPPLADLYRLVRVQKKKNSRVVGNLKIAFYGKIRQQENWIPTKVEAVTTEWMKITPAAPLTVGEYALVEMLPGQQMNLYVWDFGVDPVAPQNPATWTPVQPKPSQTGTNEIPALETRPH